MINYKKGNMKQKEQKQSVRRTIIDAFIHNGGHIAFLIIIGVITGILWWLNN